MLKGKVEGCIEGGSVTVMGVSRVEVLLSPAPESVMGEPVLVGETMHSVPSLLVLSFLRFCFTGHMFRVDKREALKEVREGERENKWERVNVDRYTDR